jgi:2-C-methyl-D-erythritol 4-phosphate cytidylyltransferase / 2-C-methyl-D-erythritol 2,4-cyclodiphosphate synthase
MNYAIILAAGQGQRMNQKEDKLLMMAGGHPVVYHSLMIFNEHPDIDEVFVVTNKINKDKIEKVSKDAGFKKVKKVLLGGLTRQQSLQKALELIEKKADKEDIVVVHNAANPLVTIYEISDTIEIAQDFGACIVCHGMTSTIKEVDGDKIVKTHDREKLFAAETPQAAKYSLLKKAADKAEKEGFEATDEASLIENLGKQVAFIEASEDNFKVTTQGDYKRLRLLMGDLPADIRVGIGQDSHSFDDEKMGLTLGGVLIKEEKKLLANSDGDVVLHAIFNALSQALGDMSLGFYADKECEKGVTDSKKYLEPLLKKLKKEKLEISNIGLMIECKRPKIDPLAPNLKKSVANILGIKTRRVGVTATSGENLTVFGQGLGIQCFAIVSLKKS